MQWKSRRDHPGHPSGRAAPPAPPPGPQPRRARLHPSAAMLAAVALAGTLAWGLACSRKPSDPNGAGPARPTVLRVGWPKGVEPALIDNFVRTWAARQNVRLDVVGYDVNADVLTKARTDVATGRFGVGSAVERGKLTAEQADAALARMVFTDDLDAVASADVVIEAVPERLDLKIEVFRDLDQRCQPSAPGFGIKSGSRCMRKRVNGSLPHQPARRGSVGSLPCRRLTKQPPTAPGPLLRYL